MLIYDAVITGSFSYNGVNISDVTGSEASINALNQFTSSYNTGSFTGSFIGNGSGLLGVVSASFASNARSASFASTATSASQAQNAVSSSYAANADLLDGKNSTEFAITGSNIFTGIQYNTSTSNPNGFGASASIYTDGGLRVTRDAYVSGTIFVNNLSVFGTQSINYITSSQLNISTNIISVNTDTPFVRFGGLSVYDSGSTGLTGSILWDSERDHWVYSNPSGSSYNSGMLISGPRNSGSLGTEQGTINNVIVKGQGGDHVTSSQIIDDGTTVRIPGNLQVTGSLSGSSAVFSSTVIASNGTLTGGTGTTNTLSKFTGTNTIGNSLFTDNGTNGAFGGTNYSAGTNVRTFNITSTQYAGLAFWTDSGYTGDIFSYFSNGNMVISADPQNIMGESNLFLAVDGVNIATLNTTNVTLSRALSGSSAVFSSTVTANNTVSINTDVTMLRFGNQTRWGFQRPASDNRYVSFMRNMNATATPVWTVDGDNGNVGIGNTSFASDRLAVSLTTTSPTTGSPPDSSTLHIRSGTTTAGNGPILQLSNTSGAKETAWRISAVTTSGNNGDLVFNGYAGGADFPERMRITSGGITQLSGTNGAVRLEVRNTDNAGYLAFTEQEIRMWRPDGSGATLNLATQAISGTFGGHITFSPLNTERMRITGGGNVLIGKTTDDGQKLQVNGAVRTDNVGLIRAGSFRGGLYTYDAVTGAGTDYGLTLFAEGGTGNGNIYFCPGGSVTKAMTIATNGAVTILGSLSKGSGSFRIKHPLTSKKNTHQLVHSFIEGPQADLIYRGKIRLNAGKAIINIDEVATMTEGTFEALCREVQCFTTNETGWDAVRGKVTGNILTIESQNTESTDEISWMVVGERQDEHMIDTSWTDENGRVIVEPLILEENN